MGTMVYVLFGVIVLLIGLLAMGVNSKKMLRLEKEGKTEEGERIKKHIIGDAIVTIIGSIIAIVCSIIMM